MTLWHGSHEMILYETEGGTLVIRNAIKSFENGLLVTTSDVAINRKRIDLADILKVEVEEKA